MWFRKNREREQETVESHRFNKRRSLTNRTKPVMDELQRKES